MKGWGDRGIKHTHADRDRYHATIPHMEPASCLLAYINAWRGGFLLFAGELRKKWVISIWSPHRGVVTITTLRCGDHKQVLNPFADDEHWTLISRSGKTGIIINLTSGNSVLTSFSYCISSNALELPRSSITFSACFSRSTLDTTLWRSNTCRIIVGKSKPTWTRLLWLLKNVLSTCKIYKIYHSKIYFSHLPSKCIEASGS
jgi:hypothetical protein